MSENVFADDWIECLESHYMHVIRTKDKVTEPSLSIVMNSAGFNDKQLAELRVRATMHVDDSGEDFVPDLDVLDEHEHHHEELQAAEAHVYNIPVELPSAPIEVSHPVEAEIIVESEVVLAIETPSEELLIQVDDVPATAELDAVEPEMTAEADALTEDEPSPEELQVQEDEAFVEEEIERHDPDEPQQLSLF